MYTWYITFSSDKLFELYKKQINSHCTLFHGRFKDVKQRIRCNKSRYELCAHVVDCTGKNWCKALVGSINYHGRINITHDSCNYFLIRFGLGLKIIKYEPQALLYEAYGVFWVCFSYLQCLYRSFIWSLSMTWKWQYRFMFFLLLSISSFQY